MSKGVKLTIAWLIALTGIAAAIGAVWWKLLS